MSNGTLREFHTSQDPPQPLHTDLATIPGIMPITDAYTEASGNQHTIVAAADGAVHELWWTPAEVLIFKQYSSPFVSSAPISTTVVIGDPLRVAVREIACIAGLRRR